MLPNWGYESEYINGIEFKDASSRGEFDEEVVRLKGEFGDDSPTLVEKIIQLTEDFDDEYKHINDEDAINDSAWNYAQEDL